MTEAPAFGRWEPKQGDRVRLLNPEGWVQPFRRFAEKGRPATVVSVYKFDVLVKFDVLRGKGYPHTARVHPADIVPLPPAPEVTNG